MQNFNGTSVFFVQDTPRAMEFYTNTLGFKLDWTYEENGRPFVVRVSLFGLEVILNQKESPTNEGLARGRIFIGLEETQSAALLQHVRSKGITTAYTHWGEPTLVIRDLDDNELFFWLSDDERAKWQATHVGVASSISR